MTVWGILFVVVKKLTDLKIDFLPHNRSFCISPSCDSFWMISVGAWSSGEGIAGRPIGVSQSSELLA